VERVDGLAKELPMKFSGDYKAYLKRFEPMEEIAVRRLRESCEKHGADADKILESFSGIPLHVMENLAKEFEKAPRRSPNLDLMLFRDPAAVYPVYHAFARHKLMMERRLTAAAAKEKSDEFVRDARAESAKYYKEYGQPELAKAKGEMQTVPWWAKIRLWANGLPTDLANNAFVNEFLRTLKEYHQYRLADRLHVLFALKPRGTFRVETFKDRLTRATATPSGNLGGTDVYESISGREGTLEAQILHHMLMESPEKVKFTYERLYHAHRTGQPEYRLAQLAEHGGLDTESRKRLDEQIDRHIQETDAAINTYHETFRRDYRVRVDYSMARPQRREA